MKKKPGRQTKTSARTNEDCGEAGDSPPREVGYLSDREQWLSIGAETAVGEARRNILCEVAATWRQHRVPGSTLKQIETFLDGYLTTEARLANDTAASGKKAITLLLAAHEPFTMALGVPEDPVPEFWRKGPWPPKQKDFDRRLAVWLRAIIIDKDMHTLGLFVEALQRIPKWVLRPGVEPSELLAAADIPAHTSEESNLGRLWHAFWNLIADKKRLPTKEELATEAEIYDASHASRFRRRLGLHKLPHQRRR